MIRKTTDLYRPAVLVIDVFVGVFAADREHQHDYRETIVYPANVVYQLSKLMVIYTINGNKSAKMYKDFFYTLHGSDYFILRIINVGIIVKAVILQISLSYLI